MNRRRFLEHASLSASLLAASCTTSPRRNVSRKPNVLFILADQWRAQATGYAGDPNAVTPHLDRLAARSVNMDNAVSGCPVCSPYRASLMTGRYPLTHGVFLNDVLLEPDATSVAEAFNEAGYDTGYIGKWHLNGPDRSAFIPRSRRQGFKFWKAMECTHNYNNSYYYGDRDVKLRWDGYDAVAQTREAQRYIREHTDEEPFALFVSWGPPHSPYNTAPERYRHEFADKHISLRPNVPPQFREKAVKDLRGYYAHIAALDDCVGALLDTVRECGIEDDTVVVFTSDHGDMLYSQGLRKKQKPYEESARVPFLISYPAAFGRQGRTIDMPFNAPDIMPTLLGLCGIDVPETVEGTDYSGVLRGTEMPRNNAVLLTCPSPFGQWNRVTGGGREYRGVRSRRYTYVRDLDGPWLLYDNMTDPYQLDNLCANPEYARVQGKLDELLWEKLAATNDEFLPGPEYIRMWGHIVDETGTVRYTR